jgi:hypothetical protein
MIILINLILLLVFKFLASKTIKLFSKLTKNKNTLRAA